MSLRESSFLATLLQFILLKEGGLSRHLLGTFLPSLVDGVDLFDIGGELLITRIPLKTGDDVVGYVDVALHEVFGNPFHQVCIDRPWNPAEIVEFARERAAALSPVASLSDYRFIIYSYPKIGVQFLNDEEEIVLIDGVSGDAIRKRSEKEGYGHYSRFSMVGLGRLGPLPPGPSFEEWIAVGDELDEILGDWKSSLDLEGDVLRAKDRLVPPVQAGLATLVRACATPEQEGCFHRLPQVSCCWCVTASVETFLDFFLDDEPTLTQIAYLLGQGTSYSHASELPKSDVKKVVALINARLKRIHRQAKLIEDQPSGLQALMDEVGAGRPVVLFSETHCYCVVGIATVSRGGSSCVGIALLDPLGNTSIKGWTGYNTSWFPAMISSEPVSSPFYFLRRLFARFF